MSGFTSLRNSLLSACSAAQRLLGSRFNMWSNRSRADGGMLGRTERVSVTLLEWPHTRAHPHTHTLVQADKAQTHKANSSLRRLRYCFFGFMVWKKGSLITSGQTAGQGLPQIRLRDRNQTRWCEQKRPVWRDLCGRGYWRSHLMSSSWASSWLA